MKSTFKMQNPDAVEMTLTVTMTLKDWQELRHQLVGGPYLSVTLASHVRKMVDDATNAYHAEHEGNDA